MIAIKWKTIERKITCKKETGASAAPNPTIKLSKERAIAMNTAISNELAKLSKYIEIEFVTPTKYSF